MTLLVILFIYSLFVPSPKPTDYEDWGGDNLVVQEKYDGNGDGNHTERLYHKEDGIDPDVSTIKTPPVSGKAPLK